MLESILQNSSLWKEGQGNKHEKIYILSLCRCFTECHISIGWLKKHFRGKKTKKGNSVFIKKLTFGSQASFPKAKSSQSNISGWQDNYQIWHYWHRLGARLDDERIFWWWCKVFLKLKWNQPPWIICRQKYYETNYLRQFFHFYLWFFVGHLLL